MPKFQQLKEIFINLCGQNPIVLKLVISYDQKNPSILPPERKAQALLKGCSVRVCRGYDELLKLSKEADVLACFPSFFSPEFVSPNLKWIHSFAAGVDQILVPEVVNSGILVTNSSGVHMIPVSEHAFAMILAFERGLKISIENQEKKEWSGNFGIQEVAGKTFCIVGTGRIGGRIALLAKAMGCKTIGISRKGKEGQYFDLVHKTDRLRQAVSKADYVVSVLPLTQETKGIFNKGIFGAMKKTALFVNVGRGKTVIERDLISALGDRKIRGACLDVFETEPLPAESPLWIMQNVIVTPHSAGDTPHYLDRALDLLSENLNAYMKGESMPNLIDKIAGY